MSETLIKAPETAGRKEQYAVLMPQIDSLLAGETDLIACLANICAAVKETFDFLWVGFYFVRGDELVLGPFQGPLACNRIKFGKGVCGTAWKEKRTIVVPDVDQFPGHIACSSLSKSEIVAPVFSGSDVVLVMDIDSIHLNDFSETDRNSTEALAQLISDYAAKRNWFA